MKKLDDGEKFFLPTRTIYYLHLSEAHQYSNEVLTKEND